MPSEGYSSNRVGASDITARIEYGRSGYTSSLLRLLGAPYNAKHRTLVSELMLAGANARVQRTNVAARP